MKEEKEAEKFKDVTFREIMRHYKPKSLAVLGILASFVAAF